MNIHPTSTRIDAHRILDNFRAPDKSKPIHPLEQQLLTTLSIQLCLLPWMLGCMQFWAQCLALVLAILAFSIALTSRNYTADLVETSPPFRLVMWPKLLRFPVFWIGLYFLAYVAIQAINPAYIYVRSPRVWWMAPIRHITWLPTSAKAPYSEMNTWRMMVIYSTAFLTICALYVGITRRKSMQLIFIAICCNAFLLAVLGMLQRMLGTNKILFTINPPAAYFVATFIYKNHAGCYFNLLLSTTFGLAYWYYARAQRRFEKSNPGPLLAFFSVAIVVIVIFSYSRAATLLMIGLLILSFFIFLIREFIIVPKTMRSSLILAMLVAGFALFLILAANTLQSEAAYNRMTGLFNADPSSSITSRIQAAKATTNMITAHPFFGWGAGDFRYYFPVYQRHFPEISFSQGQQLFWEHSHNDYLELFSELGLFGTLPIAFALIYYLIYLVKVHFWSNPVSLWLLFGSILTLAHSSVDFVLYNPAILITAVSLGVAAVKWAEFEENRSTA